MILDINSPRSLSQLLNQQLIDNSKNCYPYSLAASRNDPPNQQILDSLKQLVYIHPKWLEIARRLSDQSQESYQMVSQYYSKDFIMYRSFLNSSFLRKDQPIINIINQSIINVVKNGESLNNQNAFIFFQTLSMFLLETVQQDFTFFIPFFSSQFSQFIGKNINSNSQKQMQCMLILIQKFLAYQKKNLFHIKFNQNHLDFNKLIIFVFELCLQKPNTLTLQILSTLTQKISMYDIFITYFDKIVTICEILLVQFNREMKKIIQQNPEEVIHYQDDMVNDQRSQTIYTQASKLMKKLVTNIDGIVIKLFHHNVSQIKQIFVNNNTQNNIEKLELRYLQFSILKKAIKDRIDLIQELTEFIGDYFENIFCFRQGQDLLNSRLIAFVADFITEFPGKYFESTIKFLFEGIERNMDIVGLRIYKALEYMMSSPELQTMIQPSIQSIAPKLIGNLGTAQTYHFFELFTQIIDNYDEIAEKYFSRIFSSLTNKIIMQIQNNQSKGVFTTQSIKQIFKCIKVLFNKQYLLEDLYDTLQDTLQLYVSFLQNPLQIDFQQLILDMASIIIRKGKTLTKFVLSCLQSVRGIYEKNKSLDPFFELFYELCRSATHSLLEYPNSVDFMITIMVNYLQQNLSQSSFWTACYSRGCVLFQLIIQHLQPLFVQGQLRQRVINDTLNISKSMEKSPHPQFVNIIISLYYISPFDLNLPLECLKLTEYYNNKLRSLYYITKLKTSYSIEILQQALQYYKQYFHHYEPKPKQQNINPLTQNQYLVDVDEEIYLKSLSIPLREVNDITMLQQVIHELKLSKRIDTIQLTQQQRNTLSVIPKMGWFGKQLRKVYKFVSTE